MKNPFSSTGQSTGRLFWTPTLKSSSPCPGAVWTSPVPASAVTWSPVMIGDSRS